MRRPMLCIYASEPPAWRGARARGGVRWSGRAWQCRRALMHLRSRWAGAAKANPPQARRVRRLPTGGGASPARRRGVKRATSAPGLAARLAAAAAMADEP